MMRFLKKINALAPIDKPYHDKFRYYLAFYVETLDGKRRWYRVNHRIFNAINLYRQSHNGNMPYYLKNNAFVNVPLTPYFSHNRAGIGVGKIIRIDFRKMHTSDLCARSQFVMKDNLVNHFFGAYRYMRHDFGKYSRLQVFIDLYLWRRRIKEGKK